MPRKTKPKDAPLAAVPSEVLDQFAPAGPMTAFELEVAVKRFKKALIERALGAELGQHLGYPAARASRETRRISAMARVPRPC